MTSYRYPTWMPCMYCSEWVNKAQSKCLAPNVFFDLSASSPDGTRSGQHSFSPVYPPANQGVHSLVGRGRGVYSQVQDQACAVVGSSSPHFVRQQGSYYAGGEPPIQYIQQQMQKLYQMNQGHIQTDMQANMQTHRHARNSPYNNARTQLSPERMLDLSHVKTPRSIPAGEDDRRACGNTGMDVWHNDNRLSFQQPSTSQTHPITSVRDIRDGRGPISKVTPSRASDSGIDPSTLGVHMRTQHEIVEPNTSQHAQNATAESSLTKARENYVKKSESGQVKSTQQESGSRNTSLNPKNVLVQSLPIHKDGTHVEERESCRELKAESLSGNEDTYRPGGERFVFGDIESASAADKARSHVASENVVNQPTMTQSAAKDHDKSGTEQASQHCHPPGIPTGKRDNTTADNTTAVSNNDELTTTLPDDKQAERKTVETSNDQRDENRANDDEHTPMDTTETEHDPASVDVDQPVKHDESQGETRQDFTRKTIFDCKEVAEESCQSTDTTPPSDDKEHQTFQEYRKPDKPSDYVAPQTRSQSNTGAKVGPAVEVTFVAIPSQEFKMNEKSAKLFMAFKNEEMGGFNEKKWGPIQNVRRADGFDVYEITIPIPAKLVRNNGRMEYKYVVRYTKENDKDKWNHEYIPHKYQTHKNRELHIPKETANSGVWHQYDGIIHMTHTKWDTLIKLWRWTARPDKEEETKRAVRVMLPELNTILEHNNDKFVKAENLLQDIDNVAYCAESRMKREGMDEERMKQVLTTYLEPLLDKLATVVDDKETENEAILRLVRAVVISQIVVKYDLMKHDYKTFARPLCYSLLIRSDLMDYKGLDNHFSKKSAISIVLTKLLDKFVCSTRFCEPMWVLVVPLFHLLREDHKHTTKNFRSDAFWWGTAGIENMITVFQRSHQCPTAEHIKEYQRHLEPLFHHDHLLPRTLMALATYKRLKTDNRTCFTPEAIMANMLYAVQSISYVDLNLLTDKLQVVQTLVMEQKASAVSENNESIMQKTINDANLLLKIAVALLGKIVPHCKRTANFETVVAVITITFACINSVTDCIEHMMSSGNTRTDKTSAMDIVNRVGDIAEIWLLQVLKNYPLTTYARIADPNEMEAFSALLNIAINEKFDGAWKPKIINLLQQRYSSLKQMDRVEVYCNADFSKFHDRIQTFFSNMAFDSVEHLCKRDIDTLIDTDPGTAERKEKVQRLLSRVFSHKCPGGIQPSDMLNLVLTWSPFVRFLDILYGETTRDNLLTDHISEKIQISLSLFNDVVEQLKIGDIEVKIVQQMINNRQNVLEIQKCIDRHTEQQDGSAERKCTEELLGKILRCREIEWRHFDHLRQGISGFVQMCGELNIATIEAFEKRLHAPIESLKITDLCKPLIITDHSANITYTPSCTILSLSEEDKECMTTFKQYRTNNTFLSMWHNIVDVAKRYDVQAPMQLREVVTQIWNPACERFQRIYKLMKTGTITFKQIDEHFIHFEHKHEALKKELLDMAKVMNDTETKWVPLRVDQVHCYHTLHLYADGAKIMLELKESFELTGDFTVLENLLAPNTNKDDQLISMAKLTLSKAANVLEGIDESKANCLKTYLKCKELVCWLKEALDGPGQLKVLVDLAMITASGQGDMEVKKVKMLHAAVIGYAPLLYELKKDADFEKFLECCKSVWRTLDSDPKLPTKLNAINQHLDWLKKVKDSKGTMELNAFEQAEKINNRGIYRIGNIKHVTPKNIDEALELTVTESKSRNKGTESRAKTYTFAQLNDLQSKLMLVAGKAQEGKEEVDRFVEIFDGVTRLTSVYLKLCNAGSILFKNWNCTFLCKRKVKINARIDIGLEQHFLQGKSSDMDVSGHIVGTCQFLETCFKEWLDHIESKRNEYPNLNFFTTEQLVILRSECAAIHQGLPCDKEKTILAMLSSVRPDCKISDLRKAIREAFIEIRAMHQSLMNNDDMEKDAEKPPELEQTIQNEQQMFFIQELENSGIQTKIALKALATYGVDNLQDALLWCMEETSDNDPTESDDEGSIQHESDSRDSSVNGSREDISNAASTLEEITTDLLTKVTSSESLQDKLRGLWEGYLKTVSTTSGCLSVQNLGQVLNQLSQKVDITSDRPYPEFLKVGRPNLLVCPAAEILQTVLALYMHDEGRSKPLPQRHEVLLCYKDTSAEQLELMLRLAANDERRTFYCLADVGSLTYDVALKAETSFEKYTKHIKDLRLVVVCSRETEDRSHIVTFLEQFRVPYTAWYKPMEIQDYLKTHFKSQISGTAPMLDQDRSAVRVLKSHRAGVGKTLKVRRLCDKLKAMQNKRTGDTPVHVTIPLHKPQVDILSIINRLKDFMPDPDQKVSRIFHIDLAHEVQEGVDHFLFNLLVLGSVMDKDGTVWQRSNQDLYLVETMPLLQAQGRTNDNHGDIVSCVHRILSLLPTLTCWSPVECLLIIQGNTEAMKQRYPNWQKDNRDQLMDDQQFRSESFQRVYQYLEAYSRGATKNLSKEVDMQRIQGDHLDCLKIFIQFCGITEPSWAELCHFVNFLNVQLRDCELSDFCDPEIEQDLPDFRKFVVKFMINMSRDFATRSLDISEETPGVIASTSHDEQHIDDDIVKYNIKRRWETSPHPYIFFNADPHNERRHSMTFLGFSVSYNGDIVDPRTKNVLDRNVLTRNLQRALVQNRVQLNENFDNLQRAQKIERICLVVGMDMPHDPDPTYELTTDNVKKMLAIHMRFRCQIPVVVMGETGCGKTRLVKFMCDLQKPPGATAENLVLVKVHGGITDDDIQREVDRAGELAKKNRKDFPRMDTVLFFDEANTTDAIGLIKEIMCDRTMRGQPLPDILGLKFVVACNPYRKHSKEVIKGLEKAGLGYHVQAEATKDKLGRIPMRQLVYRVHALPQSMLPLVWDFGQLNQDTEELYIRQMVQRAINENHLPNVPRLKEVMSAILSASQEFMKHQKDECSFVSLRDVDRVIRVMTWFFKHRALLFALMYETVTRQQTVPAIYDDDDDDADDDDDDDDDDDEGTQKSLEDTTRALILALGVCYHACLQKRTEYRQYIGPKFAHPFILRNGPETISDEINRCQEVFLDQIQLGANIARNQALKENLFMMVICIELRIPLFLVGKPGSSKSLAKTVVADAMQRDTAQSELFKKLKLAHMISFQCSPLSRPDGIVGTFHQCAQLQEDKDLDQFVAVVVLDEVGLAEDSPLMPLKTLHPLLEDGCPGNEKPTPHKKVACIAISNWALDPAKMNRGIHVQRGVPDVKELEDSAKGICSTNITVQKQVQSLFQPLAEGYLQLYEQAVQEKREFFGLRDFYSLVKMVYGFAHQSGKQPTWFELKHAILRNFGGLERMHVDPVEIFKSTIQDIDKHAERKGTDPDCSPSAMIKASLFGDGLTSESRYLLILTENYAALGILQQELLNDNNTTIIFGSSFPKDQEYTQVCRNINKIKVCMEAGRTVVLLNLENLYESLYDALNQYYVKLGGDRFVDLGLGTQRVKCEVHEKFKLVVVAEKEVVYEKFPIPLINRLEKHFLAMSNMLTDDQIRVVEHLETWTKTFASELASPGQLRAKLPQIEEVFIGYNVDTAASVTMQVCKMMGERKEGDDEWADQVFERAQDVLLQCATPDAVVRLRDTQSAQNFFNRYFDHQKHSNLCALLFEELGLKDHKDGLFLQVTTHSKLLSNQDITKIGNILRLMKASIKLAALQAFDTEYQFTKMLKDFFENGEHKPRLLLLQCDSGHECSDLIACARYLIQDEYTQPNITSLVHVVFVIQLPKNGRSSFVGFQGGRWVSYHIDDLQPEQDYLPPLKFLKEQTISGIFAATPRLRKLIQEATLNTSINARKLEREDRYSEENTHLLTEDNSHVGNDFEDVDKEETLPSPSEEFHRAKEVPACRVKYDEKYPDFTQDATEGQTLDISRLVERCIHGAAAMIKDYREDAVRKTKRVEVLLNLLGFTRKRTYDVDVEALTFLDVLSYRMYQLLKDKEDTATTIQFANSWLRNEAASVDAVNKAGTFRRALWQYLEAKVTPMLAALIAYADRNRNMDLLILHDRTSWIHKFWLNMLLDLNVTEISYKDLQTVLNRAELTEFQVETSGCDKMMFSAVLPFSWVIFNRIESLIYQATGGISVGEDPECMVLRILEKETSLGRLIQASTAELLENEFVDMYLQDFVRMTYRPHSNIPDKEYKLIEDCIRRSTTGRSLTLPGVHLTHKQLKSRLHLCSQAFQMWPDCINKLPDATEGIATNAASNPGVDGEMMLDVTILGLMLEELSSNRKKLDDEQRHQTHRKDWMKKVDEFRPVIERILTSVQNDDWTRVLPDCAKARHMWTRISVVYLFIQHVCPSRAPTQKGKTRMYSCLALWTCLKEDKDTDFKSERALKSVEKFLKSCNKIASNIYFGKANKICLRCEETMNTPMSLPCGHVVCKECIDQMKDIREHKCHECKAIVPDDFEPRELEGKEEAITAHNQYKQRCNAFFMAIISRFCFDGEEPPEPAVVHKLMGYVTCESKLSPDGAHVQQRTRGLTVFNDSIDPTPVVRSFLLQLLLRSKGEAVQDYLDEYFGRIRDMLVTPDQIMELCLLCVHCLEDHHYVKLGQYMKSEGKALYTRNLMDEFKAALSKDRLNTVRLKAIASMRFALSEVAEYVHYLHVRKDKKGIPGQILSELFCASKAVCSMGSIIQTKGVTHTSLFMMQQLKQRFGLNALQQIGEVPEMRWIIPDVARNTEGDAEPDRYAILGDPYTTLREQVAQIVLGKTPEKLQEDYQDIPAIQRERNLLLAVHSEITSLLIQPEELRPTDEILTSFEEFCRHDLGLRQTDILHGLFTNGLGGACRQLTLRANQNVQEKELVELILHCWIVLEKVQRAQLPEPLVAIMVDTANVLDSFLPTMPDDHLDDVREALLKNRPPDDNPVMYQCPNGHPYVITECGRPYYDGTCSECGSVIGGRRHQAHQGNLKIEDTKNRTAPGHILGRAAQRGDVPVPERLSPASTCALRMLVHMAMVLGANRDPQITCQMLRPQGSVSLADTVQFLWEHLEVDLKLLGTALNKSPDESVIVMHLILDKILSAQISGVGRVNGILSSMVERQQWEQKFTANYIDPVLMRANEAITAANNHLMNDTRFANNHLLKTLYEVEQTNTAPNINEILSEPAMWRGRFRVTIDHLSQQFQEYTGRVVQTTGRRGQPAEKKHDTLALFLQEEHQARALRFLPGIIKLQKILSQKFHRNIDKSEANKLTVCEFIEGHVEAHMRDEVHELTESFAAAWELIKNKLGAFAVNGSLVPAQYCEQSIGPGTSLSMLLPTPRGEGLCGTALVHYLVHVHNNIMENYARIAKQTLAAERSVSVQEVTQAHLVSYHPDRDLMPIILANCNYSLTAGQSTTIEYDYGGMEQQITDRFIRGRSRIRPEVHSITFREDFTTEAAFSHLQSKIAQEPALSANLQQYIKREHRHLTELNDSLAPLNKAIEFMITVGGDKDTPLLDFIENTLRMPSGCLTNAAQGCRLKHTQALWLLLSHERAKHLALGDQDVFGNIEDMYKEELPTEAEEALTTCFLHLASLELLHSYLFEYIVLKLAVRQNGNDEDCVDNTNYPLHFVLNEYAADRGHTEIQALSNGNFPKEIPLKCSVATWKLAYRVLKERA